MKTFQFRLARVLHIRAAQERTEQQKLDRLQGDLRRVQSEITDLDNSLLTAQQGLRNESQVAAAALTQLHAYEQGARRLRERLIVQLTEQDKLVRAQMEVLVVARRNVKLLEKLREKQREAWLAEAGRDDAATASDFAAAQWIRSHPRLG